MNSEGQLSPLLESLLARCDRFPLRNSEAFGATGEIQRLYKLYKAVVFPGLAAESPICRDRLSRLLAGAIAQFRGLLIASACWTMKQTDTVPLSDKVELELTAASRVDRVLEQLPQLVEYLYHDVEAACLGDPACLGSQEVIICYPGFRAIMLHRLSHELYRQDLRLLARMVSEWSHSVTGIDIHPGAKIGHHFFIDHGTGVVIGETSLVGNQVKIYQGVTLGALSFAQDADGKVVREEKRHPTIEDHVVIYAGATVLGGSTTIGHHSVIGGSVWVTNSVAPYSTVVMEKPRLRIRKQGEPQDVVVDYQI